MNDPISYWEWSQLSITDQSYFVDETYVAICDATAGGTEYHKGDVLLTKDYRTLYDAHKTVNIVNLIGKNHEAPTDSVFRISNEISHDAGYLITFDITNPLEWDNYYTKFVQGSTLQKVLESEYKTLSNKADYKPAPTLLCTQSGIYGQREYAKDQLVSKAVYDSQDKIKTAPGFSNLKNQASFEPAYVLTAEEVSFKIGTVDYHMFEGNYINQSLYQQIVDGNVKDKTNQLVKDYFDPGYICISTIEVADKEYILNDELISETRYNELKTQAQNSGNTFLYGKADAGTGELSRYFSTAYVCTNAGNYGGGYFEQQKNYEALDFCGLPSTERNAVNTNGDKVFEFNFDAFNLLATDFHPDLSKYKDPYWNTQAVNYTATYNGNNNPYTLQMRTGASDSYDGTLTSRTINKGHVYQRVDFEAILNEKAHYMPVKVDDVSAVYYVVNKTFEKANIYYPVGKVISEEDYNMLNTTLKDNNVTRIPANSFSTTGTYYYCTENYYMSSESDAINDVLISETYSTTVPLGTVIT
ncbi:MAG: hypothetical protein J6U43_02240, partial [Bacteroidales bacterium]|nr:hypothetical protein [Bacteroidales bacterium]